MSLNSSVVVSKEDIQKIKAFILKFENENGYEISIAQFVKKAIKKDLEVLK